MNVDKHGVVAQNVPDLLGERCGVVIMMMSLVVEYQRLAPSQRHVGANRDHPDKKYGVADSADEENR